jgi:hypothetical protein
VLIVKKWMKRMKIVSVDGQEGGEDSQKGVWLAGQACRKSRNGFE